jgi:hypothetical protein
LLSHAEAYPDDAADALAHAGELAFEVNTAPQPACGAAATLVFQGDSGRAEALFRSALRLAPEHPHALYGLARALPDESPERTDVLAAATSAHPTYLGLLDFGKSASRASRRSRRSRSKWRSMRRGGRAVPPATVASLSATHTCSATVAIAAAKRW